MKLICLGLAGMFNAAMDKVDHHFQDTPLAKIKNPKIRKWFNEHEGWRNKYVNGDPLQGRIKWVFLTITYHNKYGKPRVKRLSTNKPVQLCDSWHFFKMCMVICIALAVDYSEIYFLTNYLPIETYPIACLIIGGLDWNITFRLFYSYLFKTKTYSK